MYPFYMLLSLFVLLVLAAFVFLVRWEKKNFVLKGKGSSWLRVRISTLPIAMITAAIVIIPARAVSGMEAMVVVVYAAHALQTPVWLLLRTVGVAYF